MYRSSGKSSNLSLDFCNRPRTRGATKVLIFDALSDEEYKKNMSYLDNFYHLLYGPEDGRRWVFVHGLMGYGQNWRKIISGLEASERCLTYDQRGHGRSMKPDVGYSPEDYADDLKRIVDELGWTRLMCFLCRVNHGVDPRSQVHIIQNSW